MDRYFLWRTLAEMHVDVDRSYRPVQARRIKKKKKTKYDVRVCKLVCALPLITGTFRIRLIRTGVRVALIYIV